MKRLLISLFSLVATTAFAQFGEVRVDGLGNVIGPNPVNYITGQSTLQVDGVPISPGGGGVPGGSNTQFQYNNSSVFGGTPLLTLSGGLIRAESASFLFTDVSDPTKRMRFILTNVPTGVTEDVIVPNTANPVLVAPANAPSNQFSIGIGSSGAIAFAQPAFSDLSGSATDAQVPNTLTLSNISNLTTNGFVKTSAGTGALSVDTNTYLTGNQTITLSGDVTGSGTTAITTTNTLAKDGTFTLQNTASTTKQARFDLSNITAGQTRTINVPDTNSTTAQSKSAVASNFLTAMSAQGVFTAAQPAFTDISGTATNGQLPATISSKTFDDTNTYTAKDGSFTLENTASTTKKAIFGLSNITAGQTRTVNIPDANSTTIQSDTGAANNFLTAVSAQGVISKAQPAFSNLSGNWTLAQGPTETLSTLLGRGSSGNGVPQEITLGSGLSMSGTTLSVSAGGGNVSNSGTPTSGQVAIWQTASTIAGVTPTLPITSTSSTLSLNMGLDFGFAELQTITGTDTGTTNDYQVLKLRHLTSGTPAADFAAGLQYSLDANGGTNQQAAELKVGWSNPVLATRSAYMDFQLANNGAAPASKMRLFPSGGLNVGGITSTDPGAGIVNANIGLKINGSLLNFSHLAGSWTLAQGPSTTASTLLGRTSASAGIPQEITLGTNLSMSGTTLNAAGGSGSPGGSNTYVQFNDSGAFGGDSQFTFDKATGKTTFKNGLSIGIGPISSGAWIDLPTSGPSGIGTGGAGANPFLAYASGAGQWFGATAIGDVAIRNATGQSIWVGIYNSTTGAPTFGVLDGQVKFVSTGLLGWSSGADGIPAADVALARVTNGIEINNGTPGTYRDLFVRNLTISGTCTGCGGSGSPGGANTQVQFNDSGAFGGDAGFTYDKTTDSASLDGNMSVGAAGTGGLTAPSLSIKGPAGSLIGFSTTSSSGGQLVVGGSFNQQYGTWDGSGLSLAASNGNLSLSSTGLVSWSDVTIGRNAAGVLEINNGTTGQWGALKAGVRDSGATTVVDGLTLGHQTSGTPAAGFGIALQLNANDSTTADVNQAEISSLWTTATHNSNVSDIVFKNTNGSTTLAEAARISGAGYVDAKAGFKINGTDQISATQTLTNKRINPRVDSSTAGNATTWAPNADTTDIFELAGTLTVAVTTISNPSGTPVEGQRLMIRVKSDSSAHALTWSGTQWRASGATGAPALPTTTTASKNLYVGFVWNSTDSKWDLLAVQDGF